MPNHPSVIARPTDGGFAGRYVHNEGHPDARVPLLRALYAGPFASDLDAMQRFLVDTHPAGWSKLGNDPTADTGWINPMPPYGDSNFRCYCHGDRNEEPQLCTHADTDGGQVEWVYLLKADGIEVLLDAAGEGPAAWRLAIFSPWPAT